MMTYKFNSESHHGEKKIVTFDRHFAKLQPSALSSAITFKS